MTPNQINDQITTARKQVSKALPKAWEIARKNTEEDKKRYAKKQDRNES